MKFRDDPDIWAVAVLCAVLAAGPGLSGLLPIGPGPPRLFLAIETESAACRAAGFLFRLGERLLPDALR
jgi:hypothetical protein